MRDLGRALPRRDGRLSLPRVDESSLDPDRRGHYDGYPVPAWELYMLQRELLLRMARDFATPSARVSDESNAAAPGGAGPSQQVRGAGAPAASSSSGGGGRASVSAPAVVASTHRRSWEDSMHPYLFLPANMSPIYFGFSVDEEGHLVRTETSSGSDGRARRRIIVEEQNFLSTRIRPYLRIMLGWQKVRGQNFQAHNKHMCLCTMITTR